MSWRSRSSGCMSRQPTRDFDNAGETFYTGTSYRHIIVARGRRQIATPAKIRSMWPLELTDFERITYTPDQILFQKTANHIH